MAPWRIASTASPVDSASLKSVDAKTTPPPRSANSRMRRWICALASVGAHDPEPGIDAVAGPAEQSTAVAALDGDRARGAEEAAQDAVGAAAEEPGDRHDLAGGEADALAGQERRADRPPAIHARRLDVAARPVMH